ncbi:MAG: hypothetical protein AAF696_31030 [Bacteroidota bacterium]
MRKILGVMYASNQEYLTAQELSEVTKMEGDKLIKALKKLMRLGELKSQVSAESPQQLAYGLEIRNIIKNLKENLKNNRNITHVAEDILDGRDDSNLELNQFLEDMILLNSEILDFSAQRMCDYFQQANKK